MNFTKSFIVSLAVTAAVFGGCSKKQTPKPKAPSIPVKLDTVKNCAETFIKSAQAGNTSVALKCCDITSTIPPKKGEKPLKASNSIAAIVTYSKVARAYNSQMEAKFGNKWDAKKFEKTIPLTLTEKDLDSVKVKTKNNFSRLIFLNKPVLLRFKCTHKIWKLIFLPGLDKNKSFADQATLYTIKTAGLNAGLVALKKEAPTIEKVQAAIDAAMQKAAGIDAALDAVKAEKDAAEKKAAEKKADVVPAKKLVPAKPVKKADATKSAS